LFKDQDKDKDFSSKDKDKDCIVKDKAQDKDCILVLKESLRTRTRTNITVFSWKRYHFRVGILERIIESKSEGKTCQE